MPLLPKRFKEINVTAVSDEAMIYFGNFKIFLLNFVAMPQILSSSDTELIR
jgi:hypothetical protein